MVGHAGCLLSTLPTDVKERALSHAGHHIPCLTLQHWAGWPPQVEPNSPAAAAPGSVPQIAQQAACARPPL